jgi:hemoglobin
MAKAKSLYERLGGYDAIAAFITEYIGRIRADPQFARFGGGRGTDKKKKDLQLNIDYMCKITGGSNYYMGRDMKTAHAGLGITDGEWAANVKHMVEALNKYKIPQKESKEVLALLDQMKREIVEK